MGSTANTHRAFIAVAAGGELKGRSLEYIDVPTLAELSDELKSVLDELIRVTR